MTKDTTEMRAVALATAKEAARKAVMAEEAATLNAAAGDLVYAQIWWDNADGHRRRARRAFHRAAAGRPA